MSLCQVVLKRDRRPPGTCFSIKPKTLLRPLQQAGFVFSYVRSPVVTADCLFAPLCSRLSFFKSPKPRFGTPGAPRSRPRGGHAVRAAGRAGPASRPRPRPGSSRLPPAQLSALRREASRAAEALPSPVPCLQSPRSRVVGTSLRLEEMLPPLPIRICFGRTCRSYLSSTRSLPRGSAERSLGFGGRAGRAPSNDSVSSCFADVMTRHMLWLQMGCRLCRAEPWESLKPKP